MHSRLSSSLWISKIPSPVTRLICALSVLWWLTCITFAQRRFCSQSFISDDSFKIILEFFKQTHVGFTFRQNFFSIFFVVAARLPCGSSPIIFRALVDLTKVSDDIFLILRPSVHHKNGYISTNTSFMASKRVSLWAWVSTRQEYPTLIPCCAMIYAIF